MVLYTDAEITATQSNTVAANKRRSFLRKLIASWPRGAHRWRANLRGANLLVANQPCADRRAKHQPTKDQPVKARLPPTPPVDPVPSRARGDSRRSQPANGKAGSR